METSSPIPLSQTYTDACAKRSLKANSSLVSFLSQFNLCPDHLTELDLSRTSYVGPQGFIPVIESIVLSPLTRNLKILNASDNRITNESLEILLDALVDRFASAKFPFAPSPASLTNNSYFEFALDVSKNPITFLGGKKILAFLAQIKANNESRINRIPISIDVNVDNTLVTPTGIVSIDEICQKQRLEVKFGEKLGDPLKELAEIEKRDQEHKEMLAERERAREKERKEMLESETARIEKERIEEEVKRKEDEKLKAEEAEKAKQARLPYFLRNNKNENTTTDKQEIVVADEIKMEKQESSSVSKSEVIVEVQERHEIVTHQHSSKSAAKSFKNIFIYHPVTKTWKAATPADSVVISTLEETHECFVKPFSTTVRSHHGDHDASSTTTSEKLPAGFSPHFPPLPISCFAKHLHEKLLQDNENVKQYWTPKKSSDDNFSSSDDTTALRQQASNWVGASYGEKQHGTEELNASASGRYSSSYQQKAPTKLPSKYGYKQPVLDSDTESEHYDYDDEVEERPRKQKVVAQKMMNRRLS